MSLKRIHKLRNTLAFRLSLLYATIFIVSSLVALLLFYLMILNLYRNDFDEDCLEDIREFRMLYEDKGIIGIKNAIVDESKIEEPQEEFLCLMTSEGDVIATTDLTSWSDLGPPDNALKRLRAGNEYVFETLSSPERKYDARVVYGMVAPGLVLQVGKSTEEYRRYLDVFSHVLPPIIVFIAIVAGIAGWFMAKRAMRGVEEVTDTALEISSGGTLEKRVPIKSRGDEIERLAITFNGMLDRIHALITGIREMTNNIAHDLKSPLTAIRGFTEVAILNDASKDEYRKVAADTVEQCDNLLDMINSMLDMAEAESGARKLQLIDVDASRVILDACELFEPLAEKKDIALECLAPGNLIFRVDVKGFQRIIANLLDNALKYTPDGGKVAISCEGSAGNILVTVTDTGIGISEDDLPNIFKRFYRCDKSRGQSGTGLGLSLVRAIVIAHKGSVEVESQVGVGTTFTVTLPINPAMA